jgi:hypothetical protein
MRRVAAVALISAFGANAGSPNYAEMWGKFKADYGKSYDSNAPGEDEASRFEIFKQNVDKIHAHNAMELSYTLGVNEFADLTAEEFVSIYVGGYRPEIKRAEIEGLRHVFDKDEALDDAVDWVSKGAVTPVKNQGQCGSCWAFSTTGAVEGAYFTASGKLLSLSEEDLVQCDHNGDQGCNGGLMDHAFDWVKKNGICSEEDYPYTSGGGKRGQCRSPRCSSIVTVTGHVDVDSGDEDALKSAVAKQPVSVAIEADKSAFQLYKGGVLDSKGCGKQLDHGVLLVGYGTDAGKDYWKVKNSWGASWGEEGYIRLSRGNNMCGIAQQPSYPTGATPSPPGPAPGPSPPPSPPAPPAGDSHYGNPADGCQDDEQAVRVQGLPGSFCSPACKRGQCPSDVPDGVTADPECVLRSPTGESRCALECESSSECGDARCHKVGGTGICTYKAADEPELMTIAKRDVEMVV